MGKNVCRHARVRLACGSGRVRKDHLARRRAHCVCRAGAVKVNRKMIGISSLVRAIGRFHYVSLVVSAMRRPLARHCVGRLRTLLGDTASSDKGG